MKKLARALTPPFLWRAASRAAQLVAAPPPPMFSGRFDQFRQVADEQPWTRPPYVEACRQLLRECRAGQLPPQSGTANAVLAFLINSWPGAATPAVLDWAGGTGLRYWALRPALRRAVRWHVVDRGALAAVGRDVMGDSDELSFGETLPDASQTFDVVLIYSSLQYVEAQAELLSQLARYRSRYVIMPRLMARQGRGYVTRQDVYGAGTPCRVSSLDEVIGTMRAEGFEPVLVIEDGLDLSASFSDDVPEELRVGRESLLVFQRRDGA